MEHKPCPFCGSDNIRVSVSYFYEPRIYKSKVMCLNCEACGPYVETKTDYIATYGKWDERS